MGFKTFTEKEINSAIYKKAQLTDIKGKKHKIGKLIVNEIYYGLVKIPNPHKNEFRENKAKLLAKQLKLSMDEYNNFMNCTLSKDEYVALFKKSEDYNAET